MLALIYFFLSLCGMLSVGEKKIPIAKKLKRKDFFSWLAIIVCGTYSQSY